MATQESISRDHKGGCTVTIEPGVPLSFAETVLRYFNPSRSPYYAVVVASVVTLDFSCSGIEDATRWHAVIIPAALVLVLSLGLSFWSPVSFSAVEHEEQLRFVRAFSISAALLWMVFIARSTLTDESAFQLGYYCCVAQAATFLLYAAARNFSKESYRRTNLVQLALVTTALLSAASACLIARADLEATNVHRSRYWLVACGLYVLWGVCIAYWVRHLIGLVHLTVDEE
jgi:hypothetical protein